MNTQTPHSPLTLPKRRSWTTLIGWFALISVLTWSWQGAEMRPGMLIDNADNMATLAGDFFPPSWGNIGRLRRPDAGDYSDRDLGHAAGDSGGSALQPAVLGEFGALVGLSAHASIDGRYPRHQ